MALQELALVAYASESTRIDSAVKEQFLLGLNAPKIQEHIMCEDHSSAVALLNRAQRLRDSLEILSSSKHTSSTLVSAVDVPAPVPTPSVRHKGAASSAQLEL